MKKKIIWSIVLLIIFGLILWRDIPYLVTTTDLISNQEVKYSFENISIDNFTSSNSDDYFKTFDEKEIENIINKIDSLKLRKTKNYYPMDYSLTFFGSYSLGENTSYKGTLFTLYIGMSEGAYTITINPYYFSKNQTYKILDKDFNLDKFISELKDEEI